MANDTSGIRLAPSVDGAIETDNSPPHPRDDLGAAQIVQPLRDHPGVGWTVRDVSRRYRVSKW